MGNSQTVDKSMDKGDSHLSPGQPASAQQPATPTNENEQTSTIFADARESGPGTFEDLHKKCKDVFPVAFEGAKIIINKGLSSHFNIAHTITMSNLQPSGYRFGSTYVGTKQLSPSEAYPVLVGEIDPSGNLNASIIHGFSRHIKTRFQAQIQNSKWMMTQLSADYKGNSFTGSLTGANLDLINGSGIVVMQYLQAVSSRVALGSELLYQFGSSVPGNQMAIYTLAGRYTGSDWQLSGNLTPMAAGVHVCFAQKVTQELQVAVEMEGSLRTQECITTLGYQLELPKPGVTFKGQVDSNWCVGAVMEKRLLPMPFTLALSAYVNHVKGTYRFGVGFLLG